MSFTIYMVSPFGAFGTGPPPPSAVDRQNMVIEVCVSNTDNTRSYMLPNGVYIQEQ